MVLLGVGPVVHHPFYLVGIAQAVGIVQDTCKIADDDVVLVMVQCDALGSGINEAVTSLDADDSRSTNGWLCDDRLFRADGCVPFDTAKKYGSIDRKCRRVCVEERCLQALAYRIVPDVPLQGSVLPPVYLEPRYTVSSAHPEVSLTVLHDALDADSSSIDIIDGVALHIEEGKSFSVP